jgi:hypothetical protein
MPTKQAKSQRKNRKAPKTIGLTRQPSTKCILFGNAIIALNTTVLQTVQISSSIWLAARYVNFAQCFLNVKVLSVTIEPIQLAVGQYIEYALLPSHIPALLSGFDATPAAPLATSAIMTMPGAKRAQQGCGLPPRCTMRCPSTMQFATARIASDSPPIGYIVAYGTVSTLFNIWCEVQFSGYNTIS